MPCFSSLFKSKRASNQQVFDDNRDIEGIGNITTYTYREIKRATSDFSHKIGQGGFGCVYKGRLRDGKEIAVKVLSAESRQGVREFLAELNIVSDIIHDNLVRLYGCCVEDGHRILVYNYLENNSLAQTLLGSRSSGQSNIDFNWKARVKIILGVARGLAYLHEEVQPHIVHRDIKASNILLDKDLTPKISDFGLARLLPTNASHLSTHVAGTLGYLAPEYAIRGQVNRKSDVYSFGVLLLEIVSGRCNTNLRLAYNDQFLLERTWCSFERGELQSIIDSSLGQDLNLEEACRFLNIGLLCTQDVTKLRPNMSTVIEMLNGELDVDSENIGRPVVIHDFMQVKLQGERKPLELPSSLIGSSSDESSHASFTFTAILERER